MFVEFKKDYEKLKQKIVSDAEYWVMRRKAQTILNSSMKFLRLTQAHFYLSEVLQMETRVAIIGIIVEDGDSVEKLNSILHDYGKYIIGRMGLPYREKGINIISIAVDAPQDVISALSGKLGRLPGVSTKTLYSKVISKTKNEVSDEAAN